MTTQLEIRYSFQSLKEWQAFAQKERPALFGEVLKSGIESVRRNGFFCPFWEEHVRPEKIENTKNVREGFRYKGLSSRLRGVYEVMRGELAGISTSEVDLYMPEQVTNFAKLIRRRFPRFVGSEYFDDEKTRRKRKDVRHEDLQALSFDAESFDLVVANEVFEHIPFLDRAIAELARILRPGGKVISTFPFAFGRQQGIVKARLVNGEIEYFGEPAYHGNPVSRKGSLVFQIPGWEILDQFRDEGFSCVEMVLLGSVRHGILADEVPGVMILVAEK